MLTQVFAVLVASCTVAPPLAATLARPAQAAPAAPPAQTAPAAPTTPPPPADAAAPAEAAAPADPVLAQLSAEAIAVRPLVSSDVALAFLNAVPSLPAPQARVIWRENDTDHYLSDRAFAARDEAARAGWSRREVVPRLYYYTKYGSPLAYVRALDVLGGAGLASLDGLRVLDYGYGTVGPLRLLALCGAQAAGVDVDSFLTALYCEPADQGPPAPSATGRVTLHDGRWPAEDVVRAAVGGGYDVFLSKNTLKRGYVHPSREADPRHLIDLGVDDATYLARLHELLKPGGLALLYNICPPEAAPDEPYVPWSDGRSPFTREQWEAAGFELLALDTVDSEAARALGAALGWDSPEQLEQGIFAWYTLARRHQ